MDAPLHSTRTKLYWAIVISTVLASPVVPCFAQSSSGALPRTTVGVRAVGSTQAATAESSSGSSISSVTQDAAGLIRASQSIAAYGSEMFGDSINLYTGAFSMTQTDVSLPGNSALPMQVSRSFSPKESTVTDGAFGDWDLVIPSIGGQFATGSVSRGWSVGGEWGTPDQNKRCSYYGLPDFGVSETGNTVFDELEYFQGVNVNAPGGGELLWRDASNTNQPAGGQAWPLVTRSGWQIRCLPNLHPNNINSTRFAVGEGFLALSPEGTTYRFDWLAMRTIKSATKVVSGITRHLLRSEISMLPTLVTDRYGNTVTYTYNAGRPAQLLRMDASDGRSLVFTYVAGTDRIQSVTDGSRTWAYGYANIGTAWQSGMARPQTPLVSVAQPDNSTWNFNLGMLQRPVVYSTTQPLCPNPKPSIYEHPFSGTVTHPSGAIATFTLRSVAHGRRVDTSCTNVYVNVGTGQQAAGGWSWFPLYFANRALVSKTISGPGLPAMTWSWQYPEAQGGLLSCTSCPDRKSVVVTTPQGHQTRHTFGIISKANEGQLLQLDEGWNGTSAMRTTTYRYRDRAAGPYPVSAGSSPNPRSDSLQSMFHSPQDQRVVSQQAATFTWQASAFDSFARPTTVAKYSSLGYGRTEATAYYDHYGKWVLGQVASVTVLNTGAVPQSHSYDPSTANRTHSYQFGLFKEAFTYYGDGQRYQHYDQAWRPTTYYSYKRGIPQQVVYADNTYEAAVVDDLGRVTGITNAAGTATGYGYDAMGRLAAIVHPGESWGSYHATTQVFEQVPYPDAGLAAGHWRQTSATGNARTVRYFDGLWRERLNRTWDVADPSNTGTAVETRYDAEGHKVFVSYPQRSIAGVDGYLTGTASAYDGLGRPIGQYQDSELGVLSSTTQYLGNFLRRNTNPRGHVTTTAFQAFDSPSEDAIAAIYAPEGVSVNITRDFLGTPTAITRSGSYAGQAQSATRSYVYDGYNRLCKTIEPETGATVQDYDVAGNVWWRGSGVSLPSTSSCDRNQVPGGRMLTFGYDSRNRLIHTHYGDGTAGIGRSYTADGLPYQVWTGPTIWTYGYNNRRLLTGESMYMAATAQNYTVTWGIDNYGHVASLSYPNGPTVAYSPNALGQATQVSNYAGSITRHPNGAVASYYLANGLTHSTTLNARQLPHVVNDSWIIKDIYTYDANGNVVYIEDQQEYGYTNRSLAYDGLDRLTTAVSNVWSGGGFTYDALDNIRTSTIGTRSLTHHVDPGTNRLTALTGTQSLSFGYDANGNISQRSGQQFVFDIGNRLQSAPNKATYFYDGHGRRSWVNYADGTWKFQFYSQGGKLLFSKHSTQGETRHIYMGSKVIAETNSATGTQFLHTDALGSPVATTNQWGQLLTRTRYEPYGGTAAGTNPTGLGFTGHVNDADTGLVYMQQRYYEPLAGRFLSVDPVVTDLQTGSHFNRYVYAENNPYTFIDPDGRASRHPDPILQRAQIVGEGISKAIRAVVEKVGARDGAGASGSKEAAKAPISGNAQVTKSGGQETTHASTSARLANEAAASPDAKSVHLNQTVKTITGGQSTSQVRPDVATVRQDGKVDVKEVLSPGQKASEAIQKNEKALGNMAGSIQAVKPD
jgi:RHS repeat-associated protein